MKNTGIVRRIDELGRIVIPKEIRKVFKIDKNEAVEMFVNEDSVILKKFCNFIDIAKIDAIVESLSNVLNCAVLVVSKNKIISKTRFNENNLCEDFFNKAVFFFDETKTEVYKEPKKLELFCNNFQAYVASPVIIDGNIEYLIFTFLKLEKDLKLEIALTDFSSKVLASL